MALNRERHEVARDPQQPHTRGDDRPSVSGNLCYFAERTSEPASAERCGCRARATTVDNAGAMDEARSSAAAYREPASVDRGACCARASIDDNAGGSDAACSSSVAYREPASVDRRACRARALKNPLIYQIGPKTFAKRG
jgi:hypothetical protein